LLMGTPTTVGNFTITLQAMQGPLGFVTSTVNYSINVAASAQPGTAPMFSTQPASQSGNAGESVTLTTAASAGSTLEWRRNGTAVSGATSSILNITNLEPASAGLYQARATAGGTTVSSQAAIVGVTTTQKVIGTGEEVGANIPHPNTNIFDQILLQGAAASMTADAGQVTRISYIDLNDDIVQIEFAGAGTVSLVLDGASGPAAPVNYNQAAVGYMKGHAGIVITGANETTNVGVFSVGRATAFDPTGAYNILAVPGPTNVAANNGSSLFQGKAGTNYDGMADIAFIAISSSNGKFGGVRTSNTSYFATKGLTGVYAPGVEFTGPVFVGDIRAADDATPVLQLGSGNDVRITGGDLLQDNGRSVQVSGIAQLRFAAGSNSHGTFFAAQTNRARLEQNGADVTSQIVVNP
jgi:hypothetical protein